LQEEIIAQDGRGWILNINCFVNYCTVSFSLPFSETSQPTVYNSAANKILTLTTGEMVQMADKSAQEVPFNGIMWRPSTAMTKCQTWYYLNVIFLHLLPGLLLDGLLKLSGNKPL
jgi:hypothetical protein